MIKDIVVNLTIGVERDAAANYAVSLASIFKAHLVGVAFVYDPKVSANLIVGIPAELIDAQRTATKRLANEAVARFEALATRAATSNRRRRLLARYQPRARTPRQPLPVAALSIA